MGLLQDIQNAIIDDNRPLAAVLRMARVLAARLDNQMLKDWADHELNGYPDDAPLPPYRAARPARVLGNFSGPLGLQANDIQIAEFHLDPKLRARSRDLKLFEISSSAPVAAYEELLQGDDDDFQIPWPAGVAQFTRVFQDMTCISVGKRVSRGELVAVLDGVRNRLLSLVLDLEREAPEAGDVPSSTLPIPEEQIARLVQVNLYARSSSVTDNSIHMQGTAGNIASGQGNRIRQGEVSITQQGVDLGELLDTLRAAVEQLDGQLPPDQLGAAQGLIEDLEEEAASPHPAPKRLTRILNGITAIASATGQAGTAVIDATQAIHRALGS